MRKISKALLVLAVMCIMITTAFAASPESDFEFENGTIIWYHGNGGAVDIPSTINGQTVTAIEQEAFLWGENITSINFPSTMISIPPGVLFMNQGSVLTSVEVSEDNPVYKAVDGILFSKDGTVIHAYPPAKQATSYTIPPTVTTIGDSAFYACSNLSSIIVPDSVTSIGDSAFTLCSVTSITIPKTVKKIGFFSFYYAQRLENVYYTGSVEDRAKIDIDMTKDKYGEKEYYNQNLLDATWHYNFTPEPPTPTYSDWATPHVEFATENNLIVDSLGMDYTKNITRSQIADLLVNMVEKATGQTLPTEGAIAFNDTDSVTAKKANAAGIITGKEGNLFDPNNSATRQEIAIMIVRAIEKMEAITGNSYIDHSKTTLVGYSDFADTASWAQNFVAILANNGIMTGNNGRITPTNPTSIQECLVMNNNLFKLGQ